MPTETAREKVTKTLVELFREVYAHTGRELPVQMKDKLYDLSADLFDMVVEETHKMETRY